MIDSFVRCSMFSFSIYQTPEVVSAEQFVTQIGTDHAVPALTVTTDVVQ